MLCLLLSCCPAVPLRTLTCFLFQSKTQVWFLNVCLWVKQRAKFPSSRPPDQLILERQKQDAARDKVLEFAKYQQTWDIKNSWLKSSDGRHLRGTIQRGVRAALDQQEVHIQERRDRSVCQLLSIMHLL